MSPALALSTGSASKHIRINKFILYKLPSLVISDLYGPHCLTWDNQIVSKLSTISTSYYLATQS